MLADIRNRLLTLVRSRQFLLVVVAVLACAYSLAVLLYVHMVPDLGIRSAFDTSVRRFDGDCIPMVPGASATPEEGDSIVSLGDKSIATWPQLLQANRSLRDSEFVPVDDPTGAAARHLATIRWQGKDYVRLAFRRAAEGANEGAVQECWCLVGAMPFEDVAPSLLWFMLKIGLFAVGALVFWKRPADRSARQFFILCICTLMAYMGGYHWNRIVGQPVLIFGFMFSGVLLPGVMLHFYCVFPRPKSFLQGSKRSALYVIYGVPSLFAAGMTVFYLRTRWLDRHAYPDADVRNSLSWLLLLVYFYFGVAALWYLASVAAQVHSFRVAQDTTEKNQVKWILFGSLAALLPIGETLYLAVLDRNAFGAGAATWPMFAASVCFTTAFIISMTRYRLMQLDQILTSGMIYFLISFMAALVYVVIVFLATLFTGKGTESSLFHAISVSAAALVVFGLLDLARSRLRVTLDRRLSREQYQLDRTIRRMGQAIEQLVDPPTLARRLLQSSAEVLSVSQGAVYLREGNPPIYKLVDALGPAPALTELPLGCPLVDDVGPRGSTLAPARFRTGSGAAAACAFSAAKSLTPWSTKVSSWDSWYWARGSRRTHSMRKIWQFWRHLRT